MRIISLGWGTQSFTLAAMVALGELPPVDAAVHSDTTHERAATYEFAERWTLWLEERGVRVVTVKAPDTELVDRWGGVMIPAYTDGLIRRQCTLHWKIKPVKRWLQANRKGEKVEQLIGISLDEFQRMKPARVKYIENVWPLVDLKMTRHDCKLWLQARGLEIPPRSACVFCPFQRADEWASLEKSDWEKAVKVDAEIRNTMPPAPLYVCNQRKPLEECDFSSSEDNGQLSLWENECEGYCGV